MAENLIDLPSTAICFYVRVDSRERLRNLKIVLDYVFAYFRVAVYVGENDTTPKLQSHLQNWSRSLAKGQSIRYLFWKNDSPLFPFSKLRNEVIKVVKYDGYTLACILDADVLVPFQQMEESVKYLTDRKDLMAVYPHSFFCYLDEEKTEKLLDGVHDDVKEMNSRLPKLKEDPLFYETIGYFSRGGCVFIRIADFCEIGMDNEDLVSYCANDEELANRMTKFGKQFHVMPRRIIYHMHHPRGLNSARLLCPEYDANDRIYWNLQKMSSEELRKHVFTWHWVTANSQEANIDLQFPRITLPRTAICIPVRIDSTERLRNLQVSMRYLFDHLNMTIFLGEYDTDPKLKEFVASWNLPTDGQQKLRYYFWKAENDVFLPCWTRNTLAQYAEELGFQTLVFWDTDIIIHHRCIQAAVLNLQDEDSTVIAVYPFGTFFYLEEEYTRDLLKTAPSSTAIMQQLMKLMAVNKNYALRCFLVRGGCVVFDAAAFRRIGMYNANMISFAPEDEELSVRMSKLGYHFGLVMTGCLYHLYHPRGHNSSETLNPYFGQNLRIYNKIVSMTPAEIKDHVETWPWIHKETPVPEAQLRLCIG